MYDAKAMLMAMIVGMLIGVVLFALAYRSLTQMWPWDTPVH
jgi:hypothetical protein